MNYLAKRHRKKYKCNKCGRRGLKLWRQYSTFLNHIELVCVKCGIDDQLKDGEIYTVREDPYRMIRGNSKWSDWCDQIGWLVPAVPTQDGRTFWGYTSVPEVGCEWWRKLRLGLN